MYLWDKTEKCEQNSLKVVILVELFENTNLQNGKA